MSVKKEINTFAALINRGIHNKDYSVVNIKESQNYSLIVAVLFLLRKTMTQQETKHRDEQDRLSGPYRNWDMYQAKRCAAASQTDRR